MLASELQKIKDKSNRYAKPHLSFDEQLIRLKEKGLLIQNDSFAVKKLSHINYYRLSAYFLPFQYQKNSDNAGNFFTGTTFVDISTLYDFDAALRKLIFGALERVEVYARTQIAYYHSMTYGPFGYLHQENYQCTQQEFDELTIDIKDESKRSDEAFVKHFLEKYETMDLPLWSVVEVLSFGTLSRLYSHMRQPEKKIIAGNLKIEPKVLQNWLHAFTIIRNICAHHSRLWNKQLRVPFAVPKHNKLFAPIKSITKTHKTIDNQIKNTTYDNNASLFFALSTLKYIFDTIGEEVDFAGELKSLLADYPKVDLVSMGFVPDWENSLIWSDI